MNRLSNIATNKRKFKDPKPKHEFKPRINEKTKKLAKRRKQKQITSLKLEEKSNINRYELQVLERKLQYKKHIM